MRVELELHASLTLTQNGSGQIDSRKVLAGNRTPAILS
jgi:hypothetical protein